MRLDKLWWTLPVLLTASVHAQWRDLRGEMVPKITAARWYNTSEKEADSQALRGEVWLLQFFATWSESCMNSVRHLTELHEKYFDHGFRVIAVSDESHQRLTEEMVNLRGPGFWFGSDPENKTQARFAKGERVSVPQYYLIDAKGRVVGNELPIEDRIIELLTERLADVGRAMPEALDAAAQAYEDGAYGVAWRRADKVAKSAEGVDKAEAKYLCERVLELASFVQKTAPIWLEDKRPDQVYGKMLLITLQFRGLDVAKWAKKVLGTLSRDKDVKENKKAWKRLSDAIERELESEGKPYERKRAREMYQVVIDTHPFTRAADMAKVRIQRFDDVK